MPQVSSRVVTSTTSRPTSWSACWTFDRGPVMRVPESWLRRFAYGVLDQRYSSSVLLRLMQYHHDRSHRLRARLVGRLNGVLNGLEISPHATIGAGVVFHHRRVVVGKDTVIGQGAHLFANVNFGLRAGGYPTLGDGVTVFANCVVTGAITVGEGAVVGPNSVVLSDVPPRTVVAGSPARVIRTRSEPTDPAVQFGERGSEGG